MSSCALNKRKFDNDDRSIFLV